jgi:pimeloyl-ACP methyl ester carboxylesterase
MSQPIVYIRGYAGSTSGIDAQVDDPFYGFNKGATHVRVGVANDPIFYQFEGPMLRLMIDHGYSLLVQGDQRAYLEGADDSSVDPKSIWVYRFYDQAATTFVKPPHRSLADRVIGKLHRSVTSDGFNIEEAAVGLYKLVEEIQRKTRADRVILIAHSMGGLIARCMIQKIAQEEGRRPAAELVAKLFTYGTPHGGISFESAALNWFEDVVGPAGSDIFAPEKMYGYLTPGRKFGEVPKRGGDWDPRVIPPKVFDPDNLFCLIGTDPKDYGPSKVVVGPQSDGLVKIENAYVPGAHRAYVFKSHSGAYGEVNSEEGYQNLQRFLFGRWKVEIELIAASLNEQSKAHVDETWQADLRLSIRGVSVVITEQRADQYSALHLKSDAAARDDDDALPVPLLTTFLLDPASPTGKPNSTTERELKKHKGRARYSITLRVNKVVERSESIVFADHLEQVFDWADTIIFDIGTLPDGSLQAWCDWATNLAKPIAEVDPISAEPVKAERTLAPHQWRFERRLPEAAAKIPVLGTNAALRITVTDRGQ